MNHIDQDKFFVVKNRILHEERMRNGIGTLSEKTLHAVLKHYYEPNQDNHEVSVQGYVADIFAGGNIIEIQTAGFNRLRAKLERLLPLYNVTVVYPIPRSKWIIWIDEETGEHTRKRKSPKMGTPYEAFKELYWIKQYLKDCNIHLKLVMVDIEEYRLLNGWSNDKKKGSKRFDRVPIEIVQEINISEEQDYMQLLPFELPEEFTTKDYRRAAKVSASVASNALNILFYTGVVEKVGKRRNAIVYRAVETMKDK